MRLGSATASKSTMLISTALKWLLHEPSAENQGPMLALNDAQAVIPKRIDSRVTRGYRVIPDTLEICKYITHMEAPAHIAVELRPPFYD